MANRRLIIKINQVQSNTGIGHVVSAAAFEYAPHTKPANFLKRYACYVPDDATISTLKTAMESYVAGVSGVVAAEE